MRHKGAGLLAGSILATTMIVGGVQSAEAAGCVTPQEFAKARTGMSVGQIASLFGTNGKLTTKSQGFGTTITIRSYPACTQFGAVSVLFTNGALTTKSGVF